MTKREFLMDVIATVEKGELLCTAKMMKEYAEKEIEKMDERNQKRSSNPTKKQKENGVIMYKILEILTNPMTATEIGEVVGISTQKATQLCLQMAKSGYLKDEIVKLPKKGKRHVYSVIPVEEEEKEE